MMLLVDLFQTALIKVSIDLGGPEIGMPQHFLQRAGIRAAVE